MEKFPSNFCIIPWIGADVRPQGGVSLCCVAQEHLLDDNRDPSELETIRQNKNFTRIRQQFLKGEWPKECNYCQSYDKDEHSGYSLRKMYNQRFGLEQMAPHEFTDEAKDLMQLELNFGNICNYKCRMCSSQYSSKWMSDEAALAYTSYSNFNSKCI